MEFSARITGTGSAFPKKIVTNNDIAQKIAKFGLETNDTWIRERTGIVQRRHSDLDNPEEHNSSLGAAAAKKALEMAGKTAMEVDQIIFATCTPDTLLPSSACMLQHKIGAKKAWAMDINAACSGFIYGLATAKQFIQTGSMQTVLVVGSEVLNPIINWEDRNSCILFGDGAGAAIVEPAASDSPHRILSTHLHSDGDLWDLFQVAAGGSTMEVTPERYSQNLHKIRMKGKEIFKVAVRTLTDFAVRALEENKMSISDLDWFVPHQANFRIIEAVANRLEVPMDKVIINVDRCGNTSAGTIPTALDEAVRDGRIKKGDIILLDAFGAGLTYGSSLLRW
jgi:3-oxoacyl-[acyl-carrier-protein] synthase-3